MGFNCLKVTEPIQGDSLLLSPSTHLIDLRKMEGWVDLGVSQCFWTQDYWIWNPRLWPVRMALHTFFFLIFNQSFCLYLLNPQRSIIDHFDVRVDTDLRKDETNCNSVNGDLSSVNTCLNLCKIPKRIISLFG